MSSYESALNSANDNSKTVESFIDRYEELSKKVNALGENVSLTNDEYEEYNNIVNQIADMFPSLVQGYTDEGNAILSLKGNVEQLRDAYKEAQQEAYNTLVSTGKDNNGKDIVQNFQNNFKRDNNPFTVDISTSEKIAELKALQDMSAETYRKIMNSVNTDGLSDIGKQMSYSHFLPKALGIDGTVSDEDFENAKRTARTLVQTYQAEIDAALRNVQTLANAYLNVNDTYNSLDNTSMKSAISVLVNTINEDIAKGFSDNIDVGNYVNEIVELITSADNSDVSKALLDLFTTDFTDKSLSEAKQLIDSYIEQLAELLEEDPLELKVRLGFDQIDKTYSNYKQITQNAIKKFTGVDSHSINSASAADTYTAERDALNQFAEENSINTQDEIAFWNQCIEESQSRQEAQEKYLKEYPQTGDTLPPSSLSDILSSSLPDSETSYNDAINDFKSAVSTINSSLENADSLDASDLMELIQQFSDFDWAGYGVTGEKGVGNISNALENLKKQKLNGIVSSLTTIKSTLSDDASIQWIDNLIAGLKEISVSTNELEKSLDTIVDDFQSSIQTYYDYIGKIKDGTFSASDLMDVMQLDGFMELYETTGDIETALRQLSQNGLKGASDWLLSNIENGSEYAAVLKEIADNAEFTALGISSTADAINALQNTYNIIQDVSNEIAESGQISYSTLSAIMSQYPAMVDSVQAYLLDSTQENLTSVIDGLNECYTVDQENYYNYLQNKLKFDSDFYHDNIVDNVNPWIEKLVADYGDDLSNYKSYIEAKQAMDAEYYQYKAQVEDSQYTYYLEQAEKYQKQVDTYNSAQEAIKNTLDSANAPYLASGSGSLLSVGSLTSVKDLLDYNPNAEKLARYYSEMAKNAKQQLDIATTGMNDYRVISNALEGVYQKAIGSFQSNSSDNFKNLENNFANEYNSASLSSLSDSADDFSQTFDWIETAIRRMEESISRLSSAASSAYKTFSARNKALLSEMTSVRSEINLQQQAYNHYMQQANAVGLSSALAAKVRNGAIDISPVSGEDADKISEYQD